LKEARPVKHHKQNNERKITSPELGLKNGSFEGFQKRYFSYIPDKNHLDLKKVLKKKKQHPKFLSQFLNQSSCTNFIGTFIPACSQFT